MLAQHLASRPRDPQCWRNIWPPDPREAQCWPNIPPPEPREPQCCANPNNNGAREAECCPNIQNRYPREAKYWHLYLGKHPRVPLRSARIEPGNTRFPPAPHHFPQPDRRAPGNTRHFPLCNTRGRKNCLQSSLRVTRSARSSHMRRDSSGYFYRNQKRLLLYVCPPSVFRKGASNSSIFAFACSCVWPISMSRPP